MCIWNTPVEDRHCEYCSYSGGCDARAGEPVFEDDARLAVESMENVVPYDLFEPCRKSNIVWARYMVEYYLRSLGHSLSKIGSLFKRDHSTVMHSVHEVEKMLDNPRMYPEETKVWNEFQKQLNQ